jgi:hypothetical protein
MLTSWSSASLILGAGAGFAAGLAGLCAGVLVAKASTARKQNARRPFIGFSSSRIELLTVRLL